MIRDFAPIFFGDPTEIIQNHFVVLNFTKNIFAIRGADRDEICAIGGVIEIF